MPDIDIFQGVFLPNIQSFNKLSYSSWKSQNPNEAAVWESYRDKILAGESPTAPAMNTKFGMALVAAGEMVQQALPEPPLPPNQKRSAPTAVVS